MFQYFPGNYMWSLAVLRCLTSGGSFGEIAWIGEQLREASQVEPQGDLDAWHRAWMKLADQVCEVAQAAAAKRHRHTASSCYLRASHYYQWAEAFLEPQDARAAPTFARHLESFAAHAAYAERPIEFLQIPFQGTFLPAYFVPARDTGARATVVLSDGLDGTKEEMFPTALHLADRGINCLGVDNPGQGAALRLRHLPARYDAEAAAGAAFDYLSTRPEVDASRLGLMAASMGGYYTARAAAFEKRCKAALIWGACYDYHAIWARRFGPSTGTTRTINTKAALGTTASHLLHILGVDDFETALQRLEPYNLRGIAEKITCDVLVVHGADDRQTPLAEAQRLIAEIRSPRKELRVFTAQTGGAAHVQIDRPEPAASLNADWFLEHL